MENVILMVTLYRFWHNYCRYKTAATCHILFLGRCFIGLDIPGILAYGKVQYIYYSHIHNYVVYYFAAFWGGTYVYVRWRRRLRVSPCTSAYYASPWWLLTLSLRRRRREAALLFRESWWHLTMWGSRPSHFMIISNTKRHPNNTKTDQLPISEVITGLRRPYHNTSPPWWAAYAEIWEIRGNPGCAN